MKLEFLQILSNKGLPIFSKCYGEICGNYYENDVLLHRYLSSVKSLIDNKVESSVDTIDDIQKVVRKIKSGLIIIFGIAHIPDENKVLNDIDTMIKDINHMISLKYLNQNWGKFDVETNLRLEENILSEVILPWFEKISDTDDCPKGENCHLRLSILPTLDSETGIQPDDKIWKRMNDTYHYLRKRDEELPRG